MTSQNSWIKEEKMNKIFKVIKLGVIFIFSFAIMVSNVQASEVTANSNGEVLVDDGLSYYSFTDKERENLDAMIKSFGSGVSVFYKDLKSGYTYTYNEKQKYFIASVIKAPYCMYIYTLASEGKCDLNKEYTYYSRHYAGGTGKIQNMKVGTTFTLNELLGYAIKYSDNVAMNIIKENFPVNGFREYAKNLGLNYPEDIKNATNGSITAIDAGVYIESINDFINTNKYGSDLKNLMMSTSNPMIVSSYPVIRKYGWATASFHDIAIVEALNPYLLCICTNSDGDFNIFKKISHEVERISQKQVRTETKAKVITSTVDVNDRKNEMTGYMINNYTYFKLRDLAMLLNGTERQFNIKFNTKNSIINIACNEEYIYTENNYYIKNDLKMKKNNIPIYLCETKMNLESYSYNGSTYVKVRDLCNVLDIKVGWNNKGNVLMLNTDSNNVCNLIGV